MILGAWGDWTLFQELLTVLRAIGDRHGGVSIANVATRWVLEQPAVGAVIIGEHETPSPISSYLSLFLITIFYPHPHTPPLLRPGSITTADRPVESPPIQPGLSVSSGVRMGIAEHKDDNKKVFGFSLTTEDNAGIQAVLARSDGDKTIMKIGDCGDEYR